MEKESHAEIETLFFGTARMKTRAIELINGNKIDGDDGGRRGDCVRFLAMLMITRGHLKLEGFSESVAASGLEHQHLSRGAKWRRKQTSKGISKAINQPHLA
ncbi:hypothetical protein PABG_04052 [Paracoccidioides brasiliensis Pb03]|nr:hypothetical protein PABG_04052 [Paracoccidioides brasiliensis Pb03]